MPTQLALRIRSMPPAGSSTVAPSPQPAPDPVTLPSDEQAALLRLARAAVATATGLAPPHALGAALASAAGYDAPAAVFVTLTEAGDLRGCMGSMAADRPIAEAVADAACAAALVDPRFLPLAACELPAIRIEISVLGPLAPMRTPADLRPGVDGVIVERGRAAGLLLPEVADRLHWGGREMVEAVCRKAGLPADSWRDSLTRLSVFRTARFGGPALAEPSPVGRHPSDARRPEVASDP